MTWKANNLVKNVLQLNKNWKITNLLYRENKNKSFLPSCPDIQKFLPELFRTCSGCMFDSCCVNPPTYKYFLSQNEHLYSLNSGCILVICLIIEAFNRYITRFFVQVGHESTYHRVASSRLTVLGSSTFKDFWDCVWKGNLMLIYCNLWPKKSSKFNSRPVYCSRLMYVMDFVTALTASLNFLRNHFSTYRLMH